MPNTRSKKNRRKRRIAELDLQPGAVYKSLFMCFNVDMSLSSDPDRVGRYVIQASYNETVWFYYEYQDYRRFERLSLNDFYANIGFVNLLNKNENILNFPQPKNWG